MKRRGSSGAPSVVRAVIIRADGTREDLGIIADSKRPWRALPGTVRIWRANLRQWWRSRRAPVTRIREEK